MRQAGLTVAEFERLAAEPYARTLTLPAGTRTVLCKPYAVRFRHQPRRTSCPSPKRPRHRRTALTRERIVELALEIIDEDGLEAMNMRRLAADAGVKPMSLYHHFPNKRAILDAVGEKIAAAALGAGTRTRAGRAASASSSWACTRSPRRTRARCR